MFRFKFYLLLFLTLAAIKAVAQKNVVKTGLTGALLGDIKLGFEQKVKENRSLQFKIGCLDPALSLLLPEEAFTLQPYRLLEANGGINVSVEYRFYLSRLKAMQGFYAAPYFRYFNQEMLFEDKIEEHLFSVDTRISTFGMGGQLGYQWIFNEFFTLDLFFFGTGVDFYRTTITYELEQQLPAFDYGTVTSHVNELFEDIHYLYNKLSHEINENNHVSRLPFLFPAIRMGISVGIAF